MLLNHSEVYKLSDVILAHIILIFITLLIQISHVIEAFKFLNLSLQIYQKIKLQSKKATSKDAA